MKIDINRPIEILGTNCKFEFDSMIGDSAIAVYRNGQDTLLVDTHTGKAAFQNYTVQNVPEKNWHPVIIEQGWHSLRGPEIDKLQARWEAQEALPKCWGDPGVKICTMSTVELIAALCWVAGQDPKNKADFAALALEIYKRNI